MVLEWDLTSNNGFVVQFRSRTVMEVFLCFGSEVEKRGWHADISQRSCAPTGDHARSSGKGEVGTCCSSPGIRAWSQRNCNKRMDSTVIKDRSTNNASSETLWICPISKLGFSVALCFSPRLWVYVKLIMYPLLSCPDAMAYLREGMASHYKRIQCLLPSVFPSLSSLLQWALPCSAGQRLWNL